MDVLSELVTTNRDLDTCREPVLQIPWGKHPKVKRQQVQRSCGGVSRMVGNEAGEMQTSLTESTRNLNFILG